VDCFDRKPGQHPSAASPADPEAHDEGRVDVHTLCRPFLVVVVLVRLEHVER
jgi:hypothetical protein